MLGQLSEVSPRVDNHFMAGPDQPYAQFRDAAQQHGVTHTLSVGLPTTPAARTPSGTS